MESEKILYELFKDKKAEYTLKEIRELSEYVWKESRKDLANKYGSYLPEIFEKLYHQEDEGDFTPMSAIQELIDKLEETHE